MQSKSDLAEAQQIAMLHRKSTEDLEFSHYKVDEVRMNMLY